MAQVTTKQAANNLAEVGPDLDLTIQYYTRVLTPDGVLRENRYQEKMMRRADHVWLARVLASTSTEKEQQSEHDHKHFNYVVLPRHVTRQNNGVNVEFIDTHQKAIIFIPPSEYDNVNFDGSWSNTFYLADPKAVAAMPLSKKTSDVAHARWHEIERNGQFQRVLWDDKNMIVLVIESGDRAGNALRRIEVTLQQSLAKVMPWQNLKGYGQKEYSDFLD